MYRIYSTQITRFGKPVVVITTSFQKSGDVYGESFCIFLDTDLKIDSKIIKFGWRPSEGVPFDLTEEFMLEEALEQARVCLNRHIQNQCSGMGLLLSSGELVLELVDVMFLVRMWVRGSGEFLWDIQSKTRCDGLLEELGPIFKLPKLTCKEICDGFM